MLSEVSWTLQPWLLFAGRLGAHVRSADPAAPLEAVLRFAAGGRLELRELKGSVAVEAGLLPVFPEGWSGTLRLDVRAADFSRGVPRRILGVLDADGLRQRAAGGELGSYQLRFEEGSGSSADVEGALRDTGGPLAVAARLRIAADRTYELNGTIMTRTSASAALAAAIESLGPADAAGRRQFSLAGGF